MSTKSLSLNNVLLDCEQCKRLAQHLAQVRRDYPTYHARPVVPFGAASPKLLVVGLAPGMHGANRTGRPFTGDHAGILLYKTLHKHGFASQAEGAAADDGMTLRNCRITNAVKCLPPKNKPDAAEIRTCNQFLRAEVAQTSGRTVILALGGIAHGAVLLALGCKAGTHKFSHGAKHHLENGHFLFDSYHCSRYNINTRRLSESTFQDVFAAIRAHLAACRT